jgi:hypothetical protein
MKLAIIVCFLALIMPALVLATPSDSACFGQLIGEAAQEGGMGQYFNNDGETKSFDWNGDGNMNGQDLAFIIALIKADLC